MWPKGPPPYLKKIFALAALGARLPLDAMMHTPNFMELSDPIERFPEPLRVGIDPQNVQLATSNADRLR